MKKIQTKVKLHIAAAQANPAPPIGPALAQHGINIADFCQKFNAATKNLAGYQIPVEISIYEDRTFNFKIKQPLVSDLLKKAAGIEKGSGEPNKTKAGTITKEQLKEIVQKKLDDLNTKNIDAAMKIIEGQARSMGIEIKN